jgi:hypothetical protein
MRNREWSKFLADKICEWMDYKFKWGKKDCCIFVGECIEVMTGENPQKEFMGKYRSEKGAFRILREVGGIDGVLGRKYEKIDLKMVQRGDVATGIASDGTETVAIWFNGWWSTCENGVGRIEFEPKCGWRIN